MVLQRHISTIFGLDNELTGLKGRLNTVEADATTLGSIAKAQADATADAESNIINGAITYTDLDLVETKFETLDGADTVDGSLAKVLKDAKDYADSVGSTASSDLTTLEGRVATNEDNVGTIANLNTTATTLVTAVNEVKADFASADTTINNRIDDLESTVATGSAIKGSFETVTGLDTLNEGELSEGWMYGIRDTNDVYVYASVITGDFDYQPVGWTGGFIQFINVADVTNAVADLRDDLEAEDTRIEGLLNTEIGTTNEEVSAVQGRLDTVEGADTVEGSIAKAQKDATADAKSYSDTNKLDIAQNLADVDATASRSNLDIYSKSEIDTAINNGGADGVTETLTVSGDSVTLTYAPKNAKIDNFSTVRHVDGNGVAYDIPVSVSGKTLTLAADSTGQFDTKSIMVQYDTTEL